jgi:hypothetical protein
MHTKPRETITWNRVRRNPAVERLRTVALGASVLSSRPNSKPKLCLGRRRDATLVAFDAARVEEVRFDDDALFDDNARFEADDLVVAVRARLLESTLRRDLGTSVPRRDLGTSVPRVVRRSLLMAGPQSGP